MKKMPTVFMRDWDGNPKHVTREPNPECAWVFASEGVATRKYDGTCVMYDGARWWARREVKADKADPPNFLLIEEDETTSKRVGWEPVEQSGFARWHMEAVRVHEEAGWYAGTYELCGPKINGNPELTDRHILIRHATADRLSLASAAPTYEEIRALALTGATLGAEGIVWHHPDGRTAKIKARDFA